MELTHGERWLLKAAKRIDGWCKSRGWKCSAPRLTTPSSEAWRRYCQYEVFITDRLDKTISIAFDLYVDEAQLVDEGGRPQGFDAITFDNLLECHGLADKPKPSKRQLALAF